MAERVAGDSLERMGRAGQKLTVNGLGSEELDTMERGFCPTARRRIVTLH